MPFGIGTVTLVLIALLVATVGIVLSIGTPTVARTYENAQLRGYSQQPEVAWTASAETLPGYTQTGNIEVADARGDHWLLSYPRGIGRAYQLVDRHSGRALWSQPVVAGLGSCAFDAAGNVGCAIKLGDQPDGFYIVDDSGSVGSQSALDDTARVVGVGANFVRIDQAGYEVSMRTAAGKRVWGRTFASAAQATFDHDMLIISTADGSRFVVDSRGRDTLRCRQCDILTYSSGLAVVRRDGDQESVDTYAVVGGTPTRRPTSESVEAEVVDGPSTLPVLTTVGDASMQATQGFYQVRDPARGAALWQITDPNLSKSNTRPCGSMVAFARMDRSRVVYQLDDGERAGTLPVPSIDDPDTNLDLLSCVGSSGDHLVFGSSGQLTAFDVPAGKVAWTRPILGRATDVDGYIVLTEGTSLSVLRPN